MTELTADCFCLITAVSTVLLTIAPPAHRNALTALAAGEGVRWTRFLVCNEQAELTVEANDRTPQKGLDVTLINN